jgi:cytochrome c oxidase subunit II
MMFQFALSLLPSASTSGERFDLFMLVSIIIGTVLFVGTLGTCIYFAFKYRRKGADHETPYIDGNYTVEFLSIFGISVWVAVFFLWGWRDYSYLHEPKLDEYEINVIGKQWSWQLQYQHGKTFVNELFIPKGKPIKLIMTSQDVLHSFFLPEFRVKRDTVPGQFTVLRFNATKTGVFNIFCAEYCGTSHSKMIGKVYVMEPADFSRWKDGLFDPKVVMGGLPAGTALTPSQGLNLVDAGRQLYSSKSCNTCHSVNGTAIIGPSFKGLYGSERELMAGTKVLADENYIRESMVEPMKKIVKGYPPQMPTYKGMLSEEEINQIIAYIKSLK